MSKVCIACKNNKSLSEFHIRMASKDNYNYKCKKCVLSNNKNTRLLNKKENITIIFSEHKKCTKCKDVKTKEMFYMNFLESDRLQRTCKKCSLTYKQAISKKNKEKNENRGEITLLRYKVCKVCKVCKDSNSFYNNFSEKDGLCRECNSCSISKYRRYSKENRERINNKSRIYRKNNPDAINALLAKSRARKLNATPKWTTKDQLKEIKSFYSDAKEVRWLSEEGFEVDHIVPLQGKTVCGLHVPWNLQIITISMNRSKSNKIK